MLEKNTTCDLIVDKIRLSIVSGEILPGEKLATERDMAAEFGVSRLPLREALRVLRELGYLETRHGKGTFVKSNKGNSFSKDFANYFLKHRDSVMEVFELRRILELDTVRLASRNASDEEKAEIDAACRLTEKEVDNLKNGRPDCYLEVDREFHFLIAKYSHNSVILEVLRGIQEYFNVQQSVALDKFANIDDLAIKHRAVVDAIISGDDNSACKAMSMHMKDIENSLIRD